jgi:hypothetical protein
MVEAAPQLKGQELEDDIRKHLKIDFESSNDSKSQAGHQSIGENDNGYDTLSDFLDLEA